MYALLECFTIVFYTQQTLLAYNSYAAIGTLIGISVLSALAALLLPIETKGRPMKVTFLIAHYCHHDLCVLSRILEDKLLTYICFVIIFVS